MDKKRKTLLMMLSLGLGTFMSTMDSSVVNTAVPVIQKQFGVSMAEVEWVITAYLLVISSILLFFGRISDIFGHKKLYLTGFILFTIGSGLCSLSISIGMLIACRVFQALGAAMMFATNYAIITHHVDPQNRGKAFSVISIAAAAALSTGPVLGGTLAGALGWQSIFYINIPVGLIGICLAIRNIPAESPGNRVPLDVSGSAMVFAALFLILLPLDQIAAGLHPYLFWGMFITGVVLAIVFINYEKHIEHPMLNFSLFKIRVFSAGLGAAALNFMAQYIMAFLSPFYLQTVRMLSPAMTGLLYIPMPLATLLTAPLSGYVSDRFDTRYLSSAGMGVMAIGLFMMSFLNADTPYGYIVISFIICGIGSGLFQTPNNNAVMSNVPTEYRGISSGMLATSRNIGMVLGVAICGALFAVFSSNATELFTQQGMKGTALEQSSFVYALRYIYWVAAGIAVLSMLVSLTKGKIIPAGLQIKKE